MNETIRLWPHDAPYTAEQADGFQPYLTPFPVPGAKSAVIVCPGGAYRFRAPHEGNPVAEMLQQAGISAYVLEYRVSPCHTEAPLTDAKRALRLVRSLGYERVGILGFSAGGHLCCSAATQYDAGDPLNPDPIERLTSRPDVFIPCYAVVTMEDYTHHESRELLLGEHRFDPKYIHRFSAEQCITPDTPPAFIWSTAADTCVSVRNSLELALSLQRQGVPFELHIYPYGDHGAGLAYDNEAARSWSIELCRFLKQLGFTQ